MTPEKEILRAAFNPKVKTYWIISSSLAFVASIVGIPLLIIWVPLAFHFAGRYLKSLECVLTDRAVKLKSGVFVRNEKTIPLDKITDLGLTQGPLMRALDLEKVSVETAGSTTPGALASLIGIVGGRDFRDAVMRQKELLADHAQTAAPVAGVGSGALPADLSEQTELLREISDSLQRIEKGLANR